jgi:hypothetical protein
MKTIFDSKSNGTLNVHLVPQAISPGTHKMDGFESLMKKLVDRVQGTHKEPRSRVSFPAL